MFYVFYTFYCRPHLEPVGWWTGESPPKERSDSSSDSDEREVGEPKLLTAPGARLRGGGGEGLWEEEEEDEGEEPEGLAPLLLPLVTVVEVFTAAAPAPRLPLAGCGVRPRPREGTGSSSSRTFITCGADNRVAHSCPRGPCEPRGNRYDEAKNVIQRFK